MSEEEVRAFLDEQRVVTCATNGRDGFPHLMPLWYVMRGEDVCAWTYAASQKVRNLERDPRATLQVETGESYDQLRGVMLKARVELIADTPGVAELGMEIMGRYMGAAGSPEVRAMVERQAAKRVGLRFVRDSIATWDHRKLAGAY